jgi:hypothetical protein
VKLAFEGAFNLLCGEELGRGIHRTVFECKLDPTLVVKVEHNEEERSFANAFEFRNWDTWGWSSDIAEWLAPVVEISPCGLVLLQRRTIDLRPEELPTSLPEFLTDHKPQNYGLFEGRVVCRDYSTLITNASRRRQKVEWF